MKRAFTLIELLVVIGIMGLLGTVSVGGYRAMQRGMEERGVMQNVNTIVMSAYERAQIDRQPTGMYFWNETVRSSSEDENEVVVGKAVAVRRQGRLSRVDGDVLVDEFADLDRAFFTDEVEDDGSSEKDSASDAGENLMYLYFLDNEGGSLALKRSLVYTRPAKASSITEGYPYGKPTDTVGDVNSGKFEPWGFKVKDKKGVGWKVGSAYGFEFAEITLPHNYIFGTSFSKSATDNPVREAGTMIFNVGRSSSGGMQSGNVQGSISVYSLRPDGSGELKAERVDTVEKPKRES